MVDDQQDNTGADTDEVEVQVSAGADSEPARETDWKAQARKWEDRAKANLKRAQKLEQDLEALEGASGDLEKALARISRLEAHKKQLEHDALVAEVAQVKGVDGGLLAGSSREELEAHADRLLAWRGGDGRVPSAPALGYQPVNQPKPDPTRQVLREMFNKE